MNFKIITLPETETQICLHRDRNEEGEEIVRITAFVTTLTGKEPMLEDVVRFTDAKSACFFVKDFSIESAKGFLGLCLAEERINFLN
ncbi:hypothetical protein [Dyadobacter chenhuakuii]|uniref:Uncharacterized protein n=1 Tax=Dyadobacter chenhuakuii TaxID=2909339 RepID=A0A9X1TUN4_9BACT|nr:hypothetical protein [Dyadobacter chenhuakuii]MCF2499207.1 hypothetical protein [Dyadobacter chenhuakuii]